jgi:GNAT superfamily N-acetyltransferase
MFVRAAWRGREKGVAQRLLGTARQWASEKSSTDIFLGTMARFLAAHRFYEKNGFDGIARHEFAAEFSCYGCRYEVLSFKTSNVRSRGRV